MVFIQFIFSLSFFWRRSTNSWWNVRTTIKMPTQITAITFHINFQLLASRWVSSISVLIKRNQKRKKNVYIFFKISSSYFCMMSLRTFMNHKACWFHRASFCYFIHSIDIYFIISRSAHRKKIHHLFCLNYFGWAYNVLFYYRIRIPNDLHFKGAHLFFLSSHPVEKPSLLAAMGNQRWNESDWARERMIKRRNIAVAYHLTFAYG